MGRGPQRKTSQSRVAGGAGDVVAFTYDIYTTTSNNKVVLGATLTVQRLRWFCSTVPTGSAPGDLREFWYGSVLSV